MAQVIWTEPALGDLDAIADYIAIENPVAAAELVRRVFAHVEQLKSHPESGSKPAELKRSRYRQIVEPPCRVLSLHRSTRMKRSISHCRQPNAPDYFRARRAATNLLRIDSDTQTSLASCASRSISVSRNFSHCAAILAERLSLRASRKAFLAAPSLPML